jgi:hypothetical protein
MTQNLIVKPIWDSSEWTMAQAKAVLEPMGYVVYQNQICHSDMDVNEVWDNLSKTSKLYGNLLIRKGIAETICPNCNAGKNDGFAIGRTNLFGNG